MDPIRKGSPDFILLILTFLLTGFGILMLFSASSATSAYLYNDPLYYTKRQIIWAGIGIFTMMILMNIPFQRWKKWIIPVFGLIIITLILVLFIGVERNGAKSWFGIGSFGGQPTEFAKFAVVIYLAALISKKGEKFRDFQKGLLPVMIIVGLVAGLILLQNDFGSCFLLVTTAAVVIVAGGANLKHILMSGVVLAGVIGLFLVAYMLGSSGETSNYRIDRLTSFMDPWADTQDTGYQLVQSLYALGHGGVTGAGFGQSIQKLHYLPYSHNDFIFAIIGEELGFVGASILILLFIALFWRALTISLRCKDTFGTLLGTGFMGMIGIEALINLGGVTGSIPITGVTLPFISYGGSSLLATLMCMGVLLNISRYSHKEAK